MMRAPGGRLFAAVLLLSFAAAPQAKAQQSAPTVMEHPLDLGSPPPAFAELMQKLGRVAALRGAFIQEKRVAVLRRPLVSRGLFVLSQSKGLLWEVEEPLDLKTLITKEGIFQAQDGKFVPLVASEKQAIVSSFSQAFLAAFSGDINELRQRFSIFFQGTGQSWMLGLVPKDRLMRRFIHSLILHGSDVIDRIDLTEQNGDLTNIIFQNTSTEPAALTEDEKKRFEKP